MNFIRAKTVKAHKRYAHQFDYFGNHTIKKDSKQKTLRWWLNDSRTFIEVQ